MRKLTYLIRFAFVIAVSVVLSDCTTNPGPANKAAASEQPEASVAEPANSVASAEPASSTAALASANAAAADYRISPRDILDVAVFQVADLNKSVQVNEDGYVSLPLVGKIQLAGKTTHEAEQIIGDRLRKSYLQSPQVSIFVKQYGQRVTVNGAVKGARVLTLDGKVTLSEAIANAGGLSDIANSQRIHIARANGQQVQDDIYDLDAIQAGRAPDPVLHGGDIIVAEESGTRVALKNVKDLLPFAIFANLF